MRNKWMVSFLSSIGFAVAWTVGQYIFHNNVNYSGLFELAPLSRTLEKNYYI